jgi:uncharacterized lipoprotein YmbA
MIDRRSLLMSAMLTPAAAAGLLAGCASPDPVLYTLAPSAGPAVAGGPRTVVVRDIGLARYLDRPQVVRGTEDYQVALAQNDWWGEPLGRMIGRVLVADLNARLPGATVVAESGAISSRQAEASVEVNIQSFGPDHAGNIALTAQIAVDRTVRPVGRATRNIEIVTAMAGSDTKAQVAAMSIALGKLADAAAQMLGK